ncbi:UV-B-induced protein At3g17800, chloroplastic-like [Primulina eburnea]|uniref:UV-B-induced protein At3g17800, chloroplastic-like n=1 Tax=Primulina eburnea TaxID=1245227 RepID=UPI003C6BE8D9
MDCCLFYGRPSFSLATLPSRTYRRPIDSGLLIDRRPLIVLASASGSSARKCEFGGLNAPLEPRTPAGRFLSGVLLDERVSFQFAAREQLEMLAAERDEADARMRLSLGSDEASLHRRVAELKRDECQAVVEDIMYMLIYHKFSEIGVYLVPRISQCVYNGRLEIFPSRDWELESIHSIEAVEMVREHVNDVVGWRANSNVRESWAITEIERLRLCKLYAASVLYGYFLKSASLRHGLEWGLYRSNFSIGDCTHVPLPETFSLESKLVASSQSSNLRSASVGQVSYGPVNKPKNLKRYVMGFDKETIQMCAKPKSTEAVNLIERYTCALFDKKTGLLESDEIISTSFASLKRFVLEAVAFGSFLLEAENCVNAVYTLEEN